MGQKKTKRIDTDVNRENVKIETVKPTPATRENGVDILTLINSMPQDKLDKLVEKSELLKNAISKKALHAANEAQKHELNIFPKVEESIHNKDTRDKTGIEVWVPGTGPGGRTKKPVFKFVSKHDLDTRLKKQGFMSKEDYIKHRDINDMVDMWTKDGAKVSVFRDQVPILLSQGLSVEPPLSKKIKK